MFRKLSTPKTHDTSKTPDNQNMLNMLNLIYDFVELDEAGNFRATNSNNRVDIIDSNGNIIIPNIQNKIDYKNGVYIVRQSYKDDAELSLGNTMFVYSGTYYLLGDYLQNGRGPKTFVSVINEEYYEVYDTRGNKLSTHNYLYSSCYSDINILYGCNTNSVMLINKDKYVEIDGIQVISVIDGVIILVSMEDPKLTYVNKNLDIEYQVKPEWFSWYVENSRQYNSREYNKLPKSLRQKIEITNYIYFRTEREMGVGIISKDNQLLSLKKMLRLGSFVCNGVNTIEGDYHSEVVAFQNEVIALGGNPYNTIIDGWKRLTSNIMYLLLVNPIGIHGFVIDKKEDI